MFKKLDIKVCGAYFCANNQYITLKSIYLDEGTIAIEVWLYKVCKFYLKELICKIIISG